MVKHGIVLTLSLVAISSATVACSSKSTTTPVKPVASDHLRIPDALKAPDGNKPIGTYQGNGVQTYDCVANSWTLLEPAAVLTDDGKPVALHYRGPVWVSTVDGSEVSATAVPGAVVPHQDAVPELLLKASEHYGDGRFRSVTYVQRLATSGGLAPTSACTDGAQQSVPYSATYRFYAAG